MSDGSARHTLYIIDNKIQSSKLFFLLSKQGHQNNRKTDVDVYIIRTTRHRVAGHRSMCSNARVESVLRKSRDFFYPHRVNSSDLCILRQLELLPPLMRTPWFEYVTNEVYYAMDKSLPHGAVVEISTTLINLPPG